MPTIWSAKSQTPIPTPEWRCLSEGGCGDGFRLMRTQARSLAETGRCQIVFVVRPEELDAPVSPEPGGEPDSEELNGPETYRDVGSTFHDILKARSLGLACPIQVIREETWTGKRPAGSKPRPSVAGRGLTGVEPIHCLVLQGRWDALADSHGRAPTWRLASWA